MKRWSTRPIRLRAPSVLRCPLFSPAGAALARLSAAVSGAPGRMERSPIEAATVLFGL